MAPIIKAIEASSLLRSTLCVTGQHRELLDQPLEFFDLIPDYDLDVMVPGQCPSSVTARILKSISAVLATEKPQLVLVHGDTNSTFAASLAAFYHRIPVGHVEAGLRTNNLASPWPEEGNRQLTTVLARHHFAPTQEAKDNLVRGGVSADQILVTGNTVIDALFMTQDLINRSPDRQAEYERKYAGVDSEKPLILVTGHRRENFGTGFEQICDALRDLNERGDCQLVFPVHLNPAVEGPVRDRLASAENVHLVKPVDYPEFVWLMSRAHIILTDSGGIQEEAPSFRKPVLIMREMTERPEAVKAGVAQLVGNCRERIVTEVSRLIDNPSAHRQMTMSGNPYGNGDAAPKIVSYLEALVPGRVSAPMVSRAL